MYLSLRLLFQITTQEVAGLTVRSFEYSDEVEKRGWFLLFIFFWTTQFVVAMGQIVIALSVVKYYFTRDVETVSSTQNCIPENTQRKRKD